MIGRLAILAALLPALWPASATAESVDERFAAARRQFEYKNFDQAIEQLHKLIYPTVALSAEDDIVIAREMLGLSYFYTGQEGLARAEFTELLYLRPTHRLDTFLVPPPAVKFFDAIWNDPAMKEKLEQIERERKAQEEADRKKRQTPSVVRRIYLERSIEEHWRILTFLPFGLGQFQNGQTNKGIALAATGGLAALTNIVTWGLRWALESDGGGYKDVQLARGLRATQYASLGAFVAIWIYGVIDANYYYEPSVVPPFERMREEVEQPTSPRDPPQGSGPALLPSALPGGGGLTLGFTF